MDKIKQYLYYLIIGIISLVSLVFLPMAGSELSMSWNLPDTPAGWVVWVMTKLIVATLNILIFHCFMEQAKINVQYNENYKEARKILIYENQKEVQPKSPARWTAQQYGLKGGTVFLTSLLSAVALTQAILTFDYMSMLTYLFTILMGIVFGVIQMKSAEQYWTNEYIIYALSVQAKRHLEQINFKPENSHSCGKNSDNTPSVDKSIEEDTLASKFYIPDRNTELKNDSTKTNEL